MLTDTLCWSCSKSFKDHGCCFFDSFTPVPGWAAEPKVRHDCGKEYTCYTVIACPLYEKWDREALHKQEEVKK